MLIMIYMILQIVDCNIIKMENDKNYLKQNITISCMVYMIGNDMFFNQQCSVDYRDRPTFWLKFSMGTWMSLHHALVD